MEGPKWSVFVNRGIRCGVAIYNYFKFFYFISVALHAKWARSQCITSLLPRLTKLIRYENCKVQCTSPILVVLFYGLSIKPLYWHSNYWDCFFLRKT